MSSIPSKPKSAIYSFKRNWSSASDPFAQPSSNPVERAQTAVQSSQQQQQQSFQSLSPRSKRLAAIKQGLADAEKDARALINSAAANRAPSVSHSLDRKRPSPSPGDSDDIVLKKKRVLPDSFNPTSVVAGKSSTVKGSVIVKSAKPDSKAAVKPAKVFLSKEQQKILELVQQGQNVFYTGSAGTGKSVLLREIIKVLRKKYTTAPDAVAITASTGMAACNIGGVTIHSFAGIGLGVEPADQLANKVRKNKKAMSRWQRTKVLVIDEVSMVDGDLFDKLARVGSIIRKRSDPFGGIQLIVTGDFFQLPPVMKGGNPKFAFEAELWGETIKHTYNLTKVFRQTDQEFIDMLNQMRFGELTPASIQKFKSLSRPIHYPDGRKPTELFARREQVESSNRLSMDCLGDVESHQYKCTDGGTIVDINQRTKMLANFMAPETINLKLGAQVMLIKNLDETLVNGSCGTIVEFRSEGQAKDESVSPSGNAGKSGDEKGKSRTAGRKYPVVNFDIPGSKITRQCLITPESFKVELPNGEVQASRTQLPLILAWAMSIHKSQGQTLDRVKVDLGKVFENGQAYVALSRATSLDGLQVLNFDSKKVTADHKVKVWSKTLKVIE